MRVCRLLLLLTALCLPLQTGCCEEVKKVEFVTEKAPAPIVFSDALMSLSEMSTVLYARAVAEYRAYCASRPVTDADVLLAAAETYADGTLTEEEASRLLRMYAGALPAGSSDGQATLGEEKPTDGARASLAGIAFSENGITVTVRVESDKDNGGLAVLALVPGDGTYGYTFGEDTMFLPAN